VKIKIMPQPPMKSFEQGIYSLASLIPPRSAAVSRRSSVMPGQHIFDEPEIFPLRFSPEKG
jgi:hypothetical protein